LIGAMEMQASVVDLRYKMKDVLEALKRNEVVGVSFRGKKIADITPITALSKKPKQVADHAFFGMCKKAKLTVASEMTKLRGGRYRDI
jgi:antitoxin (DNA-binding transcriptional repressor) of toxin-antitoxin stability system